MPMGRTKGQFSKAKAWVKSKYLYIRKNKRYVALVAGLFVIACISVGMNSTRQIHTTQLLDTIARVESNNNYNAYYGKPRNTSIKFTTMSVRDVVVWQKDFIKQGNSSSAVGRYQILLPTLQGLVKELKIDESAKFDETLQDRFAATLLERRGLSNYVNNKITREQFAHNISKEWAALPKVIGENPEQSYYAGDGINQARISIEDLYASIATLKKL
jgi:conjugal transfer mating pair stabilization protein TraG